MPKIELKDILQDLLKKGYFKDARKTSDVIEKLTHRGFTIKGKKMGLIGFMLTKMCQDTENNLERRPVKGGIGKENWEYLEVNND